MKKTKRLLYPVTIKNLNKKWWQFWIKDFIIEYYTIKTNKKGEVILGEKYEII